MPLSYLSLLTSHSLIVSTVPAEANDLPSELYATESTHSVSERVASSLPDATSHNLIVLYGALDGRIHR